MKTLTKSGIRELTAKYRSVLKKCAILNAIVFMVGVTPSFATDVTTWSEFQTAVNGTDSTINVNADITYDGTSGATGSINRTLSIIGNGTSILDGNYSDETQINGLTIETGGQLTLTDITMKNFLKEDNGAAICNAGGIILNIMSDFESNSSNNMNMSNGGAIYNDNIIGNVIDNTGGITGNFTSNTSGMSGGAIYNSGTITNIVGSFKSNSIPGMTMSLGGALYNTDIIKNIIGDFESNFASASMGFFSGISGGAIHNTGIIENITGNFKNNYLKGTANANGGAIHNTGNINVTAIDGDIVFDGNYVPSGGLGGAIYNTGTVGLYAHAGRKIKFTGSKDNIPELDKEMAYDIDGIYNEGTLNINGNETDTYAGTVNLYTVSDNTIPKGKINIYDGKVTTQGAIIQKNLNIYGGELTANAANLKVSSIVNNGTLNIGAGDIAQTTTITGSGTANIAEGRVTTFGDIAQKDINIEKAGLLRTKANVTVTDTIQNEGILQFNIGGLGIADGVISIQNIRGSGETDFAGTVSLGGDYTQNTTKIYSDDIKGSVINFQNNKTSIISFGSLTLASDADIMIDADLAGEKMDTISATAVLGDGKLNISDIQLLSATSKNSLSLNLFSEGTNTAIYDKVTGNLTGLKYSPTYIYDANYDSTTGKVTFTRTGQTNPYLYAPASTAQTTATMTGQIASIAMDKLEASVSGGEKGLSAGDLPKNSNAWVKVVGFDDDVGFKHFNTIDSKTLTIAGGFNTDKLNFDSVDAVFGIYAGYIHGKQKYTDNKVEQNGGYIGVSSELTQGNTFLLSTLNAGFINNEAQNMYGTDKFDTRWFGVGMKGGYNYALTDSWTLQPNLYAGYTFVNTEDYTSKSGVRVNTDNLNFFEIDPGFKLSKQIDAGWLGFIRGKYAIVMDNGGDTKANEIALPNISTKNYFEYGIGMEKSLTDVWSLNGLINRRDGGRTGWNGSVEFKYNF